jgi:structural maintenance of chromosomes protein 5
MDPNNERMIFDVIKETSCKKGLPQYFLITPKLLPDLNFTSEMTVFCILNGPYQADQKQWDQALKKT